MIMNVAKGKFMDCSKQLAFNSKGRKKKKEKKETGTGMKMQKYDDKRNLI